MKNLRYQLSLIILCFILFETCQTKPQEVSSTEKEWVETCDTVYIVSTEEEEEEEEDNLTQKPRFLFSKSILRNLQTLRDSLYNMEDLEIYGDTIIDVNGDGYLDLILESYAGAGFGTKYLHSLYLFNPKTKLYTSSFESFLNVAFFPETKIFTSTYFGEGFISGKKYKWEGLKFMQIEAVSMEDYQSCEIKNILEEKTLLVKNCSKCFPKEYLSYLTLDDN